MVVVRFGMNSWRVSESLPKLPGEIGVVAKPTRVSNRADRLVSTKERTAPQKARGMIKPHRIKKMNVG